MESKVPAEIIDYASPNQLGVLNSQMTLWDGGGCTVNDKNLVYVD